MHFVTIIAAVLACSEAGLAFTGGLTGQVAVHSTRQSLAVDKRGDLTIGGLTLSGGGGGGGNNAQAGEAAAGTNSTGKAGGSSLTLPNGLTLGGGGGGGGNGNANANANANAQSSSLQGFLAAAEGASAKNQTGQAAPQASGAGQGEATTATPGEATAPPPPAAGEAATPPAGEPKAVAESEQFSEEAGITVDSNGNLQNLGGDLGITKGSDGSTSVGGASGINVTPAKAAPAPAQG